MKKAELNEFSTWLWKKWTKPGVKNPFDIAVTAAARVLTKAVQDDYYDVQNLKDLNFDEIRDWCSEIVRLDGGIPKRAIEIAANMVLGVLGYKAQH